MSIAPSEPDPRLQFDKSDRLAKALKIANITGIEMAEHLGLSRTTVSNYINGRTTPSRSLVRDWALRTGVPFSWLENGDAQGGGDDGIPTPGGFGSGTTPRKITFW